MPTSTDTEHMTIASDRITSSVVMVDADTASRWLTRNTRNRALAESVVKRYRDDMASGLWQFAGDPIRFDTDGNLIDGQHRLTALSRTENLTVPMLIVRGLPADSQLVMDQGRKRTPGQQLQLLGVKNGHIVAAAVKVRMMWESGLLFKDSSLSGSITSPVIQTYVESNTDEIGFLQDLITPIRQIDVAPSVAGAFVLGAYEYSPDAAREFIHSLVDLVGLSAGHPIHTLDQRLRRIRRSRENVSTRDYLAMFIQAFNAWVNNRKITKLQRPRGGVWSADRFPVIGE